MSGKKTSGVDESWQIPQQYVSVTNAPWSNLVVSKVDFTSLIPLETVFCLLPCPKVDPRKCLFSACTHILARIKEGRKKLKTSSRDRIKGTYRRSAQGGGVPAVSPLGLRNRWFIVTRGRELEK